MTQEKGGWIRVHLQLKTTFWNPNIDWSLENFTSTRHFVKMSTTWSSIGKKSTSITQSWISILIKYICSSMCLLCLHWIGSWASLMALWLSHQRWVECYHWNPNFARICESHKTSWIALTIAWYFAFVEERLIACFFLRVQVTSWEPRLTT